MQKPRAKIYIAAILFLSAPSAQARADSVDQIERYINNITTMQGSFTQAGPGETLARGQFWISRPGRMRFNYQAGMEVIADGVWLAVKAKNRKRAERYPLGATPAQFILMANLRIRQSASVEKLSETKKRLSLWLKLRDDNLPGQIELRFRKHPLALQGWTIIDAQGSTTKIDLANVARGMYIDPRVFFIEDKSIFKRRHRR